MRRGQRSLELPKIDLRTLAPGDIVRLTWRDHYRTSQRKPSGTPAVAESFGRVIEVTGDGVALFQNRVLNYHELGAEECMDGQFILSCDIETAEVIQRHEDKS